MRLKHSHCPVECGDKLVLVFYNWVGCDFLKIKTKYEAHIKLFNDGYTQRLEGSALALKKGFGLYEKDKEPIGGL